MSKNWDSPVEVEPNKSLEETLAKSIFISHFGFSVNQWRTYGETCKAMAATCLTYIKNLSSTRSEEFFAMRRIDDHWYWSDQGRHWTHDLMDADKFGREELPIQIPEGFEVVKVQFLATVEKVEL